MYDFAFDKKGLARELVRSDFGNGLDLQDPAVRDAQIASAVQIAGGGFDDLMLTISSLRGKNIFRLDSLPQSLVLRKLARNIRYLTRVRQSDRDTIIRSLRAILSEGHAYRVYKLDIRHFYESVDRESIEQALQRDHGLPPTTLFTFRSFSQALTARGVSGLPRGLAISATLAEYIMRGFDRAVRGHNGVYFYARYVDDIIIVTRGDEPSRPFMRSLRDNLPKGLQFNNGKCKTESLTRAPVNYQTAAMEAEVDFLGYRFTVFGQGKTKDGIQRQVVLDIAPRKVRRLKSRLIAALRQYLIDGNFDDLTDRFKVLTGNYNIYDFDKALRRNVGIYWNYRQLDSESSVALRELDAFSYRLLLSESGRLGSSLSSALSDIQRASLLSFCFKRSFESIIFFHFSPTRLAQLIRCWAHE